ncbi:pyridoxamine 5'-phosphate oxidase family protein [Gluconobacter wancherniae]|uniref:pyridoxamine 5'-phosphate oxidase family protein n=1 Tax=Gluconobacter wancherniae TaxID=1307955 RepID=UPI001B8B831A|nr:pyridoxamine 5'-phosphate oxidase family protein [Gluconobacter wancherniae]MBS1093217.1 pyridoxamine 5'-phosphate oxidase family protein [Gluconobacter wancherniae]
MGEKPFLPPYAIARQGKRAVYDREAIHGILDVGLVAHVGFLAGEEGSIRPMVMPMAYARDGETLYIHGAASTRMIRNIDEGAPLCLTVTHVDGIVAARSSFNHSMNYRCAVVHGIARAVTDPDEQKRALALITEHLLPGRIEEVRDHLPRELAATGVLAVSIDAASAKIRNAPPAEARPEDYELQVWGGVVPVVTGLGQPLDDGRLAPGTKLPSSLAAARKKFS